MNELYRITSVNRHGVRIATLHTSRASAIRELITLRLAGASHIRARRINFKPQPERRAEPSAIYAAMHRKPARSRVQPVQGPGVAHV